MLLIQSIFMPPAHFQCQSSPDFFCSSAGPCSSAVLHVTAAEKPFAAKVLELHYERKVLAATLRQKFIADSTSPPRPDDTANDNETTDAYPPTRPDYNHIPQKWILLSELLRQQEKRYWEFWRLTSAVGSPSSSSRSPASSAALVRYSHAE